MKTHDVLISGGAGFLGAHLSAHLTSRGHRVTILDNISPQVHNEPSTGYRPPAGTHFIRGDVRNIHTWQETLKGKSAVIHLAAETGTGQSMYQAGHYCDVNITGTANLLDCLADDRTHSISRLVVASSRAIYGEGKAHCSSHGVVFPSRRSRENLELGRFAATCPVCLGDTIALATDENTPHKPISNYAITKQAQELLSLATGESLGIPTVALRYQNIFGPGQSLSNPYTGIISIFTTLLRNHSDINIFEDGKESRDFVYISDAVHATTLALENDITKCHAINVGSGVSTSVQTVAETLKKIFQSKSLIHITGNSRYGDIRHNFADLSLAKEILGYTPAVDFHSGIRRYALWAAKQPFHECKYNRSLDELISRGLMVNRTNPQTQ